jgi:hypothetical protein
MANHQVSIKIPQKMILSKDVKFEIRSDDRKLGELLVSKGNLEWVPANATFKKRRLSWEKFALMMEKRGKVARMNQ